MSEENAIVVSDFEGHEDASEVIAIGEGQYQLMGLSDIWGLIGNALKYNLIENAKTLFDMLVGNPGKYSVADLIAAIKKTIADVSGKITPAPVGPPKLSAAFSLNASKGMFDDIREELEKRGVKDVKAIPLPILFGIAQLLLRYGPDIWEKIMEMIGKKKQPSDGKVKGAVAAVVLMLALLFTGSAHAQIPVLAVLPEPGEYLPEPADEPAVSRETPKVNANGSEDALEEVNEYRAKRGLAPFKHDAQLTQAALKAARQRASRGIHGHLPESDFTCLPPGATADAAGCGALDDSWGWATCCMDENYAYAGAAWVRGTDGRRYMHLFVRNSAPAATAKQTSVEPVQSAGEVVVSSDTCSTGQCGYDTSTIRRYGGLLSRGRRGR